MMKGYKGRHRGASGGDRIEKLESSISYILIVGVFLSLVLISIGLVSYYTPRGFSSEPHFTTKWQMDGSNFFAFIDNFISQLSSSASTTHFASNAIKIMALGLVILIITPFVRVFASVVFFGLSRNYKYLLITSFVLITLTVSLVAH
jgi:uncharacterized membrane protein